MCHTDFCNDCAKWCIGCCVSTSVTKLPRNQNQEEILFGDQEFYEPAKDGQIVDDEQIPPGVELIRRKREQQFRMMPLVKARDMVQNDPAMSYFAHQRKQLLNGHGYNLAIFKGHVRGYTFDFIEESHVILSF